MNISLNEASLEVLSLKYVVAKNNKRKNKLIVKRH